ncbi:MAG: polysaccharide biosynthesis tyrosine autokinase [Oligoflexia bacterium]|nr:polysaccharide biosynthesis tyrosine autokinase [Oligoflexia bacterium]
MSEHVTKQGLDLRAVIAVLGQQRRLVLTFLGAVVVAALATSVLVQKQYRAVAVVQLMPRAGQEVEVDQVVKHDQGGYLEARDRARTQIQIILSRRVREQVIQRYSELGGDDLDLSESAQEAFARSLSVTPREDTELVEIAVLNPDPKAAARLANLVADVYSETNLQLRTTDAREAKVWLGGQTTDYKSALDDATQRTMAFKQANDLVDVDEKVNGITARLSALQVAAGQATTQRVLIESKLAEHRRLVAQGATDVLAGSFQDPALDTMVRQRATIVTDSADVLSRYGDQHPEHVRAVDRIQRVDAMIAEEVKRNVAEERSQVDTLRRQEQQLKNELGRVKAELLVRQQLQGQYRELLADQQRARALYDTLGERGAEVELLARTQLNDVRIVDRAVPPTRPAKPNIPLNLGMAVCVGLAGGVGLALLRNRLVEPILSGADAERLLDVPLLGVIPSLPAGKDATSRDLYGFEHPRSLEAETFRAIRGAIQASGGKGAPRRLLITSCLADEGKSLAAVGIAAAFAQLGLRVLLVDADLHIPRQHQVFGVQRAPGLTDLPDDDGSSPSPVVPTKVPRLHLLPSGTKVALPNEFLSSEDLVARLARVQQGYDLIVYDTPPTAIITDALALVSQADGVILVVRRGVAPRRVIVQTLARLGRVGASLMGVVVNDVPLPRSAYGSRYYHDQDPAPSPAAS